MQKRVLKCKCFKMQIRKKMDRFNKKYVAIYFMVILHKWFLFRFGWPPTGIDCLSCKTIRYRLVLRWV